MKIQVKTVACKHGKQFKIYAVLPVIEPFPCYGLCTPWPKPPVQMKAEKVTTYETHQPKEKRYRNYERVPE